MGEDEVEVEDSGEGEVNSVGVTGGKDGHKMMVLSLDIGT